MSRPSQLLAALALACLASSGSHSSLLAADATPPKLVKFNVNALDNHGQPIDDLTAADFQVTDAGKPQELAIFRHCESKLKPQDSLRPGEFSNRSAAIVPNATLILFDMLNASVSAQGSARDYVVRGLQSLESADGLYLYILTPEAKLYPVHGIPAPGTVTAPPSGAPWTKDIKSLMDQAINKVYRLRPQEMDIDQRVRLTYGSLARVAGMLAFIPGRKNVVWISHGVPISLGSGINVVDYEPLLRRLSLLLNRAAVAVYPVQPVPPAMAVQSTPEPHGSQSPTDPTAVGLSSQATMQRIADLSGGPKKSTADTGAAVRQALNDVHSSYQLAYYPPPGNWDGTFHKLRVTCSRTGVRVQAKDGYYALEDSVTDEQAALDSAMASSFDSAEIGIRGTASPAVDAKGGPTTHFDFRIDPADLRSSHEGGRFTAHLALQIAGFMPDEKSDRSRVFPLDLSLSPDEHAKALKEGIPFVKDIHLGDTVQKLRLLVFDRGAQTVGTLTIPVVAPAK